MIVFGGRTPSQYTEKCSVSASTVALPQQDKPRHCIRVGPYYGILPKLLTEGFRACKVQAEHEQAFLAGPFAFDPRQDSKKAFKQSLFVSSDCKRSFSASVVCSL
jgi:hypothetical protein